MYTHLFHVDVKVRSPLQKDFLVWQVNESLYMFDIIMSSQMTTCFEYCYILHFFYFRHGIYILQIMYYGFTGLCEEFLTVYPSYFIAPITVNGSAIECFQLSEIHI